MFGIMLCSFVETYVIPFALMKCMTIVTKYGGFTTLLKSFKTKSVDSRKKSEYKYSLKLITTTGDVNRNGCYERDTFVSHLSILTVADINIRRTQLSYCGQDDCKKIPPALGNMYGAKVQYLDLSYNKIETLVGLEKFTRLEELILDNNNIGDHVTFPSLPKLRTLALNNNQLTDLESLLNKIKEKFPALTYLSLLSNKACPNQLSDIDKDDSDYQRYRYYVIYMVPQLRFLDSGRVSSTERSEALKRGEFTRVRRPAAAVTSHSEPAHSDVIGATNLRPLPVDLAALGKHKGAYGKCHYQYTGKHSEGNRFIVNSDL